MERLGLCFLSLLVVMMLPWGAYVRAAPVATPPDAPAFSSLTPMRAASAPQRCRTATLPGAVCSFDFLADDGDLTAEMPSERTMPAQDNDRTASPWQDAVPLPPPRLD